MFSDNFGSGSATVFGIEIRNSKVSLIISSAGAITLTMFKSVSVNSSWRVFNNIFSIGRTPGVGATGTIVFYDQQAATSGNVISAQNALTWNSATKNFCITVAGSNAISNFDLIGGGTVSGAGTFAMVSSPASGQFQLQLGANVNEFSIDGTLAGNSDLAVPTEKAVKTYADNYSGYAAGAPAKWATSAPTTVKAAIDRMADLLYTLNGSVPIP